MAVPLSKIGLSCTFSTVCTLYISLSQAAGQGIHHPPCSMQRCSWQARLVHLRRTKVTTYAATTARVMAATIAPPTMKPAMSALSSPVPSRHQWPRVCWQPAASGVGAWDSSTAGGGGLVGDSAAWVWMEVMLEVTPVTPAATRALCNAQLTMFSRVHVLRPDAGCVPTVPHASEACFVSAGFASTMMLPHCTADIPCCPVLRCHCAALKVNVVEADSL